MAEPATSTAGGRHESAAPSPWIRRFAPLVPAGGRVLDVACGSGRHTRLFYALGHPVTAVDIDLARLGEIAHAPGIEPVEADLEAGPWPFSGRTFAAVVVTNYLWRPLFPALLAAIEANGLLLYETFAEGNARFGRPTCPAHLLAPGELLERVRGALQVVAFEHGIVDDPRPAAIQRIAALKIMPGHDRLVPLDVKADIT
jgi:SAM-dependent methyltransferase